ncbi:MAG: response regulator transcription factor [Opitutales bacterium]|nr:response regulator transcription factor [Opitutales bacterium]
MSSVYIIEDDTLLRELVREMILSQGLLNIVGDCGDGAEGLAECLRLAPDMVITDVRLPGLDGVELSRRLRAELPQLRILLFSGLFNLSIIRRALLAKVNGIVEKKAGLAQMSRAIEAVAQGQSFFGDSIVSSMQELVSGKLKLPALESLTPRELDVLRLTAEGLTTRELAQQLGISSRTAEVHRNNIMIKLDTHSAVGLTRIAISCGVVDIPGEV